MNFEALSILLSGKTLDEKLMESKLPFGLKRFKIWEPETHWSMTVTAKNEDQARSKAWEKGGWRKMLEANKFIHCTKESFQVREL